MKKIFLLFLSSFLLTNAYAQCTEAPDVSNAYIKDIAPICVNSVGLQEFEVLGIVGEGHKFKWTASDVSNPSTLILFTETSNPIQTQLTQQLTFGETEAFKTIQISVIVENECGVSKPITTTMEVDNLPSQASLTGSNDTIICIVDPIVLTAKEPIIGVGKWSKNNISYGIIDDENNPTSAILHLSLGEIFSGKWTVTNTQNNVCPTTVTGILIQRGAAVFPTIQFTLSKTEVCVNEEVIIEVSSENGGSSPQYELLDENNNVIKELNGYGAFPYKHKFQETTKIQVKMTSSATCVVDKKSIVTDFQTITVKDPSECVISSLSSSTIESVNIYPNPFSSSITLTNIPTEVDKIEVIDVLGNVVESVENPSSSIELGEELSTGTYFVHLYSIDGVQVEKVMKVN